LLHKRTGSGASRWSRRAESFSQYHLNELVRLPLTGDLRSSTLTYMRGKDRRIRELAHTAQSMVQGSLSELTRQCGDPSCACAHDPARRHGPHLYLKFNAEGKIHSVYVPPEQGEALKSAHRAWLRFQELGAEVSAENREQFLRALKREKEQAKAKRAKARGTAK
jgi:hypothetical protein